MTLALLPMLSDAAALGALCHRWTVAPDAEGLRPLPLIAGTEDFAQPWIGEWHSGIHGQGIGDVACYAVADAVVGGAGLIWIEDRLVTAPEIMPLYVAELLGLDQGESEHLQRIAHLPLRRVEEPCLVAAGHGTTVYGHFLIELLFRILTAQETFRDRNIRHRILLDAQSPVWLTAILTHCLGISREDLVFFDPTRERVLLESALIPTRVIQAERFHPIANEMLARLVEALPIPPFAAPSRRFFILRNGYANPAAPYRICLNESRLAEIARQHGFLPVAIEGMGWLDQIALFQAADFILGQAGSALHNALFCRPGSRLASLGILNLVQSQIGTLRQQPMAYLTNNLDLAGEFEVNESEFATFLEAATAGD